MVAWRSRRREEAIYGRILQRHKWRLSRRRKRHATTKVKKTVAASFEGPAVLPPARLKRGCPYMQG